MKQFLTITIAEPSDIIREGLFAVLKQINSDFRIFQVHDVDQLHHHLSVEHPNVLIVNPSLLGSETPDNLRNANCSELFCVALATNLRDLQNVQAFDLSVSIFDDFGSLRKKFEGIAPRQTGSTETEKSLSQREKEIVSYVVKGYTNKKIADKLCLSQHTVITHRRNIANKLQIHSPSGLTIYAIVNKLVKIEEVS